MHSTQLHSNAEYNRLMQAARERAAALRRQAIRELGQGTGHAVQAAVRSARRWASSMARHRQGQRA
jgi:F0F1-type ATP synthase membrane subunit b/b'